MSTDLSTSCDTLTPFPGLYERRVLASHPPEQEATEVLRRQLRRFHPHKDGA